MTLRTTAPRPEGDSFARRPATMPMWHGKKEGAHGGTMGSPVLKARALFVPRDE
jgi:hypothetical protein